MCTVWHGIGRRPQRGVFTGCKSTLGFLVDGYGTDYARSYLGGRDWWCIIVRDAHDAYGLLYTFYAPSEALSFLFKDFIAVPNVEQSA